MAEPEINRGRLTRLACSRVGMMVVLLRELPGYDAYRQKTRWRLLPGIW